MNDYIKRSLAKAEFTGNFQDNYSTAQIHALLDTVPAADVAPVVHGQWDEWFPGDIAMIMTGEEMLWECSHCTAKYAERSNYCPHCGAIMDGGDTDDQS